MSIFNKKTSKKDRQNINSDSVNRYTQMSYTPDEASVYSCVEDVTGYLLIDMSGSMSSYIPDLESGFDKFKESILTNPQIDAAQRQNINICVIGFGGQGAYVLSDTAPVMNLHKPAFYADGTTPLGAAINLALDIHEERKAMLDSIGKPRKRAWMYIMTDGNPTDDYQQAVARLQDAIKRKSFNVYIIGIGDQFNEALMSTIVQPDRVLKILNNDAGLIFEFASSSLAVVSGSVPGQKIQFSIPENMATASV